ncbi:MAG TPA: hypothetical protein DDW27_19335, partial [Bacteroidales bacterium]|nr:hypothetical protein [Bacteroidales bacterium]
MIQRIQSVFLLLTTLLAVLFLTGDIFKFTGGNDTTFSMTIKGISEVAIDNNLLYLTNTIPVLLLSVLLPLISLPAIFLFRN